jgi:hypothetical protein
MNANPVRRQGPSVLLITLLVGGLLVGARATQAADPVLVGAGDIATCSRTDDEVTANLLDTIPGTVFTAGDNVYSDGTATEFSNCYNPSWGRHKARTRPAPGNHDYHTTGATGYYNYFGAAAGDPKKGYYSYDLGAWHVVVINSNCSEVGGCQAGSAQEQWLRADLTAHPATCTLAYWHHPLFSSGQHGNDTEMRPIWQALYDARADVVINGHDHDYERFAPQNPAGQADASRGIREFVVGTGGAGLRAVGSGIANSQVRNGDTNGVLKLTLHPTSYDWQFVPEAGKTFTDAGTAACVGGSVPLPTATPTTSPVPQANLLINPSFELDANNDGRPDTWSSSSKFTRSNAVAPHAGTYIGRFFASDNSGVTIKQNVNASAGKTYRFSCWANIPATQDTFAYKVQVRWLNSRNKTISTATVKSYVDDTNGSWNQATQSLAAPAGTTKAQIRLVASNLNATIYVDDCVFQL